jgi:hypothetical protein
MITPSHFPPSETTARGADEPPEAKVYSFAASAGLRAGDEGSSLQELHDLLRRLSERSPRFRTGRLWSWLKRTMAVEQTWLSRRDVMLGLLPHSAFEFNRQMELLRLELVAMHGLAVAREISRHHPLRCVDPRNGRMVRVTVSGERYGMAE